MLALRAAHERLQKDIEEEGSTESSAAAWDFSVVIPKSLDEVPLVQDLCIET